MELLRERELVRTGPVDHGDWNYHGLVGWVGRQRFRLVLELLGNDRAGRILEIGYGSGIFMPELAKHCNELYGIDVHGNNEEVGRILEERGLKVDLKQGNAAQMPYADKYFDVVVCISALEFVEDINGAAKEINRVLKDNGKLIFVMPRCSKVLDAALYLATGESASKDYQGRRENVVPAIKKMFNLEKTKQFFPVYKAFSFPKRTSPL